MCLQQYFFRHYYLMYLYRHDKGEKKVAEHGNRVRILRVFLNLTLCGAVIAVVILPFFLIDPSAFVYAIFGHISTVTADICFLFGPGIQDPFLFNRIGGILLYLAAGAYILITMLTVNRIRSGSSVFRYFLTGYWAFLFFNETTRAYYFFNFFLMLGAYIGFREAEDSGSK